MHALDQAKALYTRNGLDFEADLVAYMRHGYVWCGPDRFMMAKPIEGSEADWNPKNPRAWYVHMAVGEGCLSWFIRQAPFSLPFIAWFRRKHSRQALKFYPTDRLSAKLA